MPERVAIFIDGAYLDYTLRDEFGSPRIDYSRLVEWMVGDDALLRAYYYHCLPYQSANPTPVERERFAAKERFFSALSRLPRSEVRLGKLEYRGRHADGNPIFEQKRVDIFLGVDLVLLAAKHQVTRACVFAGDSDFLPAIRIAKQEGVVLHLFHGTVQRPHTDLWLECDDRTALMQDHVAQWVRA